MPRSFRLGYKNPGHSEIEKGKNMRTLRYDCYTFAIEINCLNIFPFSNVNLTAEICSVFSTPKYFRTLSSNFEFYSTYMENMVNQFQY